MAQKRARRRFTREDKAQAVQRLIESGLPLADIAAELDVSPGQLSQWRNEQLAAGSAEALAQKKADEAEMLRLKREVKRLEDENLILRKAAAFFLGRQSWLFARLSGRGVPRAGGAGWLGGRLGHGRIESACWSRSARHARRVTGSCGCVTRTAAGWRRSRARCGCG